LNDLFLNALERNQVPFVKLFLDRDFSLTEVFRNNDTLFELYRRSLKDYVNYEMKHFIFYKFD